jgi:hypothetical protein
MPAALTPPDGSASAAVALAEVSPDDAGLLRQAASARGRIARIGPKDMFARA